MAQLANWRVVMITCLWDGRAVVLTTVIAERCVMRERRAVSARRQSDRSGDVSARISCWVEEGRRAQARNLVSHQIASARKEPLGAEIGIVYQNIEEGHRLPISQRDRHSLA